MSSYTVKYNRTTNHIDGLTVRTTGGGKDMGDHVSYYAENACGSLTRYRFAQGATYATLAEALEAARKGGRKLCKTCEKAAEAQIAAEAKTKNEGAPVAAKLKLSEVRGDIRIGSATGSGGVPHAIKETSEGGNVPYCSAKLKNPLRSWGPAMDQNGNLELCAGCSKHVPTGPVTVSVENVEIPGLGRTVPATVITPVETDELDDADRAAVAKLAANAGPTRKTTENTDTTEKDTMAAKTMDKAAQDKAAEEIRADIERLPSLIAEGKDDSAKELKEEISKALPKITGTGAAAIKAKLRAELTKAEKDAKKAKADKDKADKAASTAVEVKGTQDFTKVEGVPDRIVAAAEKVKEVAAQKFARGKEVAEAIFDIRTHILDKDEDPDLTARSDQAKKAATAVYDAVTASLPEEGTDETADIIREAIGDIKKDVRNAMTDVVVGYVRSLDTTPEDPEELKVVEAERAKFKKALEAHPDLKPSEAIYKHYEDAGKALPTQTRAEIAKANREKKALERKKVEEAVKAGELSEEEAAATLSGGGEEEKTPKQLRAAFVQRVTNSFKKQVKEIRAIENAEEQEEALDELTSLISALRKELKADAKS
ncbi:hypothetical protein AB0D86_01615 [Streptomyces sp. NPDC048324]|uniref:hypothetical protein n=1 Tax=Streptomyces sp. NPDC048324 TaxID=3157205 RepID=UPI0034282295